MLKEFLNRGIRMSLTVLIGTVSTINVVAYADEPPPIFGDVTISSNFSPDPLVVRGMSGGSVDASNMAGQKETATGLCTGFVDQKPNHTLVLKTKFDYLKLLVQSPGDTTMIVSGPGGVWCNDDFDGKNPGMVGEWLPGTYKIWVGSYDKDKYFPYTLQITEVK